MSWLKRVTGVQQLIKEQRNTNFLLSELLLLTKQKPKGPRTKN